MQFQLTDSQKKLAAAFWRQFPGIASVVVGTWFLLTTFGKIGLGPAIIISGAVAVYGIWRQTRRQVDEDATIQELVAIKRVDPRDLPLEFRFISNNTTIQDVVAKAGPYSRTSETENGLCYEWDMPYHAAVMLFPEAPQPQFTGQAVWRYNLPRPAGFDAVHVYNGPTGLGLVPMSEAQIYIYATTPEPDNPKSRSRVCSRPD